MHDIAVTEFNSPNHTGNDDNLAMTSNSYVDKKYDASAAIKT